MILRCCTAECGPRGSEPPIGIEVIGTVLSALLSNPESYWKYDLKYEDCKLWYLFNYVKSTMRNRIQMFVTQCPESPYQRYFVWTENWIE